MTLGHAEVHLWRASIDLASGQIEELRALLSDDERARADRFRAGTIRDRFIATRGLLRQVLAAHLSEDPARLRFEYELRGKPFLSGHAEGSGLQFNVSHSAGRALLVLARDRRVGVDLERIEDRPLSEGLARLALTPTEHTRFRTLPAPEQRAAFYACWTRKEAWLKARGEGLTVAPSTVEIPPSVNDLMTIPSDRPDRPWTLIDLDLGPEFAGALCVEGTGWTLREWRRPDDESPGQR